MSPRPFKRIGFCFVVGACIGSLFTDYHRGWNMVAESTPEAIADLTHVLVALVGAVLATIGYSLAPGEKVE